MRRLIWGFAGRTYHIVGNLLSRLIWRRYFCSCLHESDKLLNDTPTASPSRWVCHLIVVTPWCNIHGKGYLMLHHLAGVTVQVANFVNYNCHPLDDGNKYWWVWTWHLDNYCISEQQRLRWACAYAQSLQSLRCSRTLGLEVEESYGQMLGIKRH